MKPLKDCKKLFKIFLLAGLLFLPAIFLYAETASEIREKISQKNIDIQNLEKEIAGYQAQLNTLGQQKKSLANSIKELDLTAKKLNADMSITQKKIDKTNLQIKNLNRDIGTKEDSIINNINAISLGLKEINELESGSMVENILSASDFSLVWNDINNVETVREKIRDTIIELRQVKGELEGTREVTVAAQNELFELKAELADKKKIVTQNANEKKKLLEQTENNETNYQKILQNSLAQKDALEKELRDYEAQLKYVLNPSELPSAGVFSWPLDYIFVTSQFGPRWGTHHNGTDFRASVGTPVKAMAGGTIVATGNTDLQCPGASLGGFVLIKYDNGLSSAFGHLSLIKAKKGQRVARGQIVAYSGNTGYSTGPHLHVSVYAPNGVKIANVPSKTCPGRVLTLPVAATNAYLDPMYYLPPYNQ